MNIEEYVKYDAVGLAELVEKGEVTGKELASLAQEAAEKVNNKWLVGGDYVSKGSQVLIKIKKEGHRDAWYSLRGCFLKFNDFVGEEFND